LRALRRAAAVTGVGALALNIDAIGAGHADALAVAFENAADQAAGGGLAVGAGDGNDRNAGIVAIREHHVDDGFTDGTAFAERGCEVHAQAGCGIDFNDAAALIFERLEHGVADDIDAADVEADRLGGGHGAGGEFGVHVIGHIGSGAAGGQIGIVAQHDAGAARRDGVGVVALLGETGEGDFVETDFGQRGGVAIGAAWVAVDDVDQFANGVGAIANDQRRVAAGGGDQLVADDQQAVVVAGQIFFDQDIVTEVDGNAVGVADCSSLVRLTEMPLP
jgi:hypothetical protein